MRRAGQINCLLVLPSPKSNRMHGLEEFGEAKPAPLDDKTPWYRSLNSYHWFVLVVAALGWLFDCLDQQLFVLARPAVMKSLYLSENYRKEKLALLPEK